MKRPRRAGETLKAEGYVFDLAYTSVLKRAIRTLWITLDELDLMWIPVTKAWELNSAIMAPSRGSIRARPPPSSATNRS